MAKNIDEIASELYKHLDFDNRIKKNKLSGFSYPINEQCIKSCPFCGEEPKVKRTDGNDERNGYNFQIHIECSCGASIVKNSKRDSSGWCNDKGGALKSVIEAWNSRYAKD